MGGPGLERVGISGIIKGDGGHLNYRYRRSAMFISRAVGIDIAGIEIIVTDCGNGAMNGQISTGIGSDIAIGVHTAIIDSDIIGGLGFDFAVRINADGIQSAGAAGGFENSSFDDAF